MLIRFCVCIYSYATVVIVFNFIYKLKSKQMERSDGIKIAENEFKITRNNIYSNFIEVISSAIFRILNIFENVANRVIVLRHKTFLDLL
jgi:hypothetical protein